MTIETRLSGETAALFIGSDPNSLISTPQEVVQADFTGFLGDRHAGITQRSDAHTPLYPRGTEIRNYRQVSIVSLEELSEVSVRLGVPKILPEWLGANIAIRGVPNLSLLPPNTRLFFTGGAVLVVQAENQPCKHPGKVIQDQYEREGLQELFPKAAIHLRGLVACVEKPGTIRQGEPVQVEVPVQVLYSPDRSAQP
jgi:MOSC domain-containing protein YiiM